jgi:type VI secretion system secreted protein Hcp
MQRITWFIVAGLALAIGQRAEAGPMYLHVAGIEGAVQEPGYVGQIAVDAFSITVDIVFNTGSAGGGAGSGKVQFSPLRITLPVSKASPKLFEYAVKGKHIANVALSIADDDGKLTRTYARWTLTDVFISSFQSGGSAGDDVPTEQISFAFAGVEYDYFEYDKDKKLTGTVTGKWDIATGAGMQFTTTGVVDDFKFFTGEGAVIPEPTGLFWLAAATSLLLRRRTRRAA